MHLKRDILIGVAIGATLLIAVRAAMPEAIQWYVNRTLDRAPEYDGVIGDVDLSLISGTYQIEDVDIVKTDGEVPVPLFSAPLVEFSLLWSALLDGALVGEVQLTRPQLNIVDSPDEDERQTGTEADWLTLLEELFPLRIDRVGIEGGEIHFRNFQSEPPVDLFLSEVQAEVRNLTNSQQLSDTLVASGVAEAAVLGGGRLGVEARLDPFQDQPTFDLNARLLDLPAVRLNDFFSAYLSLDMEAGTVDVAAEVAASEGAVDGYIKPIIHNLEVFDWQDDVVDKGVLEGLWQGLIDIVGELLENQPEDQFATNIPFSGRLDSPDTGILAAFGNILRNAFVEAFQSNLENTVSLDFGGDEEEPAGEDEEEEEDEEEAAGAPGEDSA